ncbi:alpha/beta fold hydrolase [Actinomycetospora chiangmaiensis]|uniref:alpha/beta fold hydrolase n=1 Tax=Actinomycetospora chiangmaiensis TaxID=402650 RepID=UPI00037EA6BB|nr:alpha/beta hydrolase [Actinomycetospora chiangmaiensis]
MTQTGPTTVFVHGFLDDGAVWRRVIDQRARPTPTAVAELAGMSGRPEAAGPFTLARHADDVAALLDGLDGPAVLVGQSVGAQIAELVAVRRPDRVAGLVLLTPVPLAGAGLPEAAVATFAALGGDGEAQRAVREQLSVAFPAAELDRLVRVGAATTAEAVADTVRAWNEGDPAGTATSPVGAPVLVVRGEEDPFVTAAVLDSGVVPRFTDVAVATVADAGHWPHLEQPEAVAGLLDDLVDRVAGAPGSNGSGGRGWTAAFGARTASAFTDTLSADVVLRASALRAPVEGREAVSAVMAAASGLYSSLSFTHEARQGPRTYLEWVATLADGTELGGVTRLLADDEGRTVDVAIHHRPLDGLLHFSDELGRRLAGRVSPDRFHRA